MRAQGVDRARVVVEHHRVVGERRPRESQARFRRRVDALVRGVVRDEHDQRVEPEVALRAPRELDVAPVRRVERAAVETDQQRLRKLELLVADLDGRAVLGAGRRSARSSSSSDGGVPSTRKPSSVRSSRQPRAFGWGR